MSRWWAKETTEEAGGLVLEGSHDFEEGMFIVTTADGRVRFSVAEVQAVDSYNSSFTCSLTATREQAEKLRDWLIGALK